MASYRKRGKTWYYRFIDADGIKREAKGCTDRRATEELARHAEAEAAKIRAGLVDPRDLARRDHAAKPIGEHVASWGASLEAKGSTAQHVALSVARVRRLAAVVRGAAMADVNPPKTAKRADLARYEAVLSDWLAPSRLADLTADRVQAALRSLVGEGLSLTSVNHYATAARMFSKWCWRSGRLAIDPLTGVTSYNAKEDRRHDRRTVSTEELQRLIEAAHNGPPWRTMTGPARALLYRLAVASGLRYGELQSIRPESFDWKAEPATVSVEAGYTKNGDVATLALPDDLAADLRPLVASVAPGAAVFALTDDRGATMLRSDLEAAKIPYRDGGGLVFDFHSLRCQTATLLDASGVSPRVAQRLMRHSTPGLTDRYTKPRAVDLTQAALSLPSLRPSDPLQAAAHKMTATGTDCACISALDGGDACTDEQPISKVFAHHLPTGGDVLGRNLSGSDVMTGSDAQSSIKKKPRERRGLTASDGVSRGETGMGRGRVELPTHGFSIRCSTN